MFSTKTKTMISHEEMERIHSEIDRRLSDSARTLGGLVRDKVDEVREEFRELRKAFNRKQVDQRVALMSREIAMNHAMKTPGLTGHDDVLKAARAYEQYLNGEHLRPAH